MNKPIDNITYTLPCEKGKIIEGYNDTINRVFHVNGICKTCLAPESCEANLRSGMVDYKGKTIAITVVGIVGKDAPKH